MSLILNSKKYDVVIVGARCAGAATAMLMARQGAKVLLVDRAKEGSDTLSTHALMRGAVMQLHNWGVLPSIVAEGTPPVRRTSFIYGEDPTIDIDLSESHGTRALYAPRRMVLDKQLVMAAREAGATTIFQTSVVRLNKGPDGAVNGVVLRNATGEHVVDCGLVVGADGRNSFIARQVEAGLIKRATNASRVAFGYFSGVADKGYRWYWSESCGGGIIPTNFGESCVFLSVASEGPHDLRGASREDGFARAVRTLLPRMAEDLEGAELSGRMRGFAGQPGHLREACGAGWALVGDAGYFKDPITAHGITDALRDAQILADSWCRGTLDDYPIARDALSRDLFSVTDRIAGFDTSLNELATLHKLLNTAMQANQQWIADHLYPCRIAA